MGTPRGPGGRSLTQPTMATVIRSAIVAQTPDSSKTRLAHPVGRTVFMVTGTIGPSNYGRES